MDDCDWRPASDAASGPAEGGKFVNYDPEMDSGLRGGRVTWRAVTWAVFGPERLARLEWWLRRRRCVISAVLWAAVAAVFLVLFLAGCGQTPIQQWGACMQRQLTHPRLVCKEPPGLPSPVPSHPHSESPYQRLEQCIISHMATGESGCVRQADRAGQ